MPDIDQNTEYGGGAILNRFAVSALSKKYKDQALNEEIMANKDTGEFLTKSPDGVVMSLDAMNRRRTAIANATEHALMQNMYGKMFENQGGGGSPSVTAFAPSGRIGYASG